MRISDWSSDVCSSDLRFGIEVDHPRYLAIPKCGMSLAPYLLYAGARPALRRLLPGGERIGLIDAHYFYPDGVAAVMLGRRFGLPVTVTARGSDLDRKSTRLTSSHSCASCTAFSALTKKDTK